MKTLTLVGLVSLAAVLLVPSNASADGGFVVPKFVWDKYKDINEPTQKAILVYDAGREDLILQVKYEGPVDEFGWLIPVPGLPRVREGSITCFYELSRFTQRRLEWGARSIRMGLGRGAPDEGAEPPVKVIELKPVGAYEVAVLAAKDSGALAKWLDANQFYFPAAKTDVLDTYVKQQWYFVAAKINLSKRSGFQLMPKQRQAITERTRNSAHLKLAKGELNPLQISFASDRCVFPLKISSINGQPSEIQIYVLSPEPLLERTMLEKKLPLIYSNDLAWAARRPKDRLTTFERLGQYKVTKADTKEDLAYCAAVIPRLADRSWWLAKQTWTLPPEEMRDLVFEPAMPVLADLLGTKYGYFAAEGLVSFQDDAVPTILSAFQNTNPIVRSNAASFVRPYYSFINDLRFAQEAIRWLKDSEPAVRMVGVDILTEGQNWNPTNAQSLIAMLRDRDAGVRQSLAFALSRFPRDLQKFIPTIQEMLKDQDEGSQDAAMELLEDFGIPIPVEDLKPLFNSQDRLTLGSIARALHDQKVLDDDIIPLLHNPAPFARIICLNLFAQNPERQSVELALPLLRDPDKSVRLKATQTLQALTGQEFTEDQPDEWDKWWIENRANFIALSAGSFPDGRAYHIRGCKYYDSRDFIRSLADFQKSCKIGPEVQDYSYYRIWLIRARSGQKEAATVELTSYLKKRGRQSRPDWPLQVGRFLVGQLTEAELLRAAASKNSRADREQRCEAYFYIGSRRLIENDQTGAADFFRKCVATDVATFEEYQSAQAALKALR